MNRIDGVIVFHALNREQIREIVDLEIDKVCERLVEYDMCLRLTDEAQAYLADKGYDPSLGARPLRRVIQSEVEDALSEELLSGRLEGGHLIEVDLADGELIFRAEEAEDNVPAVEIDNGEEPEALETVLP
jgi:ATP-dependent Clp protease ATP-binding subunit ClpC